MTKDISTNIITTDLEAVFRNTGISINSEIAYINRVKLFRDYLRDTNQQENEDSLKNYLSVISKKLAPKTVNLTIQALKKYYQQIFKSDYAKLYMLEQLFKSKEIKEARSKGKVRILEDEYLTKDDLFAIAEKGKKRLELIIKALFYTGCRISELLGVRLFDIKLNGKAIIRVIGKGKKERIVYLPVDLYSQIIEHCKSEVYLFESRNHTKLDRVNINHSIHHLGKKYGYELHAHMVRHSTAFYLKEERKLDAKKVSSYLGHSLVICLEHYYHDSPSCDEIGI